MDIYMSNINRYEAERMRLALDLHDGVLNRMAAMFMKRESTSVPPAFHENDDLFSQRLREIVTDLRPPMLNSGLKPALDELADNLMDHRNDEVELLVDVQADETRHAANLEQHLFRIVQEACGNALRHGQARKIT